MSKLYVDEIHPKTSGKQVTRPELPSFMVGVNASYTHTSGNTIQFNTTDGTGGFDQGSNFDTSTYQFIAPVSGIYHFAGQVAYASGEETRRADLWLKINGSTDYNARYRARTNLDGTTTGGSSYLAITGHWTVKLDADDTVEWKANWETDGGSDGFDSTESVFYHGTYMSGHLVG